MNASQPTGGDLIIDTTFDFRTDSAGKDPDMFSPTLRRYHQQLWSKHLPNGAEFLLDTTPFAYLHHRSDLGEFWLSSDAVIPTFGGWLAMRPLINHLQPQELEHFTASGYTMGGMMVFPGNKVDGKLTINGARGFLRRIADRMDLTLECIRRHYLGQTSPLGETLNRYRDFFALFDDFRGYSEFFLLQDLLTEDRSAVNFFMPFHDFQLPAVPVDIDAYRRYRDLSIRFIEQRNHRITTLTT